MNTNRKIYSKPLTTVYEINVESNLLVVSGLGGEPPFTWGNPAFDR